MGTMTTIDLTPIVQAVLVLLSTIITCFLVPFIKERTTNEQQEKIRALIKSGVFAAEQLYGAGHGSDKLKFVKSYLIGKGYDVNQIEIEAAVGQYINVAMNMLESAHRHEESDEPPEDTVETTEE